MNIDELKKLAGLPVTEWANSPANTAHPDPEEVAAPEADVSQSLRRYLNADPQPVKVVESEESVFEDHEVENMMAKFKEYLAEDEAEAITEKADCDCDCGKDPCETCGESHHDVKEAEAVEEEAVDEGHYGKKKKKDEAVEESADELEEKAKPDYIDIDGDGDKKEPMKKAVKDKKEKADESVEESEDIVALRKLAGIGQTTTTQTVSEDVKALKKLAGI